MNRVSLQCLVKSRPVFFIIFSITILSLSLSLSSTRRGILFFLLTVHLKKKVKMFFFHVYYLLTMCPIFFQTEKKLPDWAVKPQRDAFVDLAIAIRVVRHFGEMLSAFITAPWALYWAPQNCGLYDLSPVRKQSLQNLLYISSATSEKNHVRNLRALWKRICGLIRLKMIHLVWSQGRMIGVKEIWLNNR